ncbi:ABC transporter permease [Moraxella sp. VT-16-12]|uniref:ABC transporter permease n=1 Tax=Moraxella sp. VT-16-12 TaxID=2014877 RepID=UPI000B7E6473|nr:ABC transporter permease [Moraxella sp. VT-16-12]TWV82424.1 ABC transporter permease [Moraxella sp. VT-16-12]
MTNYLSSFKAFGHSLKIQFRVVYALLMREIITRYGRHNIGFAWLFIEPTIFVAFISLFWGLVRAGQHGIEMIPFAVIGYSVVLCWRNSASKVTKAIGANSGLLYHRNVTILDVFLARIWLEIFGALISFLLLSFIFYVLGEMSLPNDFLYMVYGGALLVWFTVAFSFVMGSLCELSDLVNRLWGMISFVMFPISGALFFVHWLPEIAKEYILYVPMVHFTEMIRHGYYGDVIPTYESIAYMISCNIILSFVGLMLIRHISHKAEI